MAPGGPWPPPRKRPRPEQNAPRLQPDGPRTPLSGSSSNGQLRTPASPGRSSLRDAHTSQETGPESPNQPASPLASKSKPKPRPAVYRNGYVVKEKRPSYIPYGPPSTKRRRRLQPFAFKQALPSQIGPSRPLSVTQWTWLARGAGALPLDGIIKDLQAECANAFLARTNDICVVAPTGFGKSMLWTLPILALEHGAVLVITPFTSLGEEAEKQYAIFASILGIDNDIRVCRTNSLGIPSIFIHSAGPKDTFTLSRVARGEYRITYVCIEMLESPVFAPILHSEWYKHELAGIYLDEAHCVEESRSWRPSYGRLKLLRHAVGMHIPLVAMSATLPSLYRESLVEYAGMRSDYILFNIGNFRPELSTVIVHMQHDIKSFKDLRFVLPQSRRLDATTDIEKSIIYCDDTALLTDMLYWFRDQLHALAFPTHAVDILHASLSTQHQRRALEDFKTGLTTILLSTEKLGAGLNVPGVRRVVQYLCSGLTMAKADQRRGRGGRSPGTASIGYYIAEKKFARGAQLSPQDPGNEDPGIVDLLQTEGCCDAIFDTYLENPARNPSDSDPSSRLCCSNCFPRLLPPREYDWIMVNPGEDAWRAELHTPINSSARQQILMHLQSWRDTEWREHWQQRWPFYGPNSLVSDRDLEVIANNAGKVIEVADLYPLTHIVHWDTLATPLFEVVQNALHAVAKPVDGM